ncbi:unnamed protein product [Schistocephalus solidus]|uniref:Expressed conserved protein n=1 Tax=Schistocephalus solidus TaxID=70667 RepID=A0A183T263_SCHSO|nr:unnamed protein product [Schistocephalus solidus]
MVHEQLEEHQKRVIDLTQDLAELRRRKLSAPSQPNLSYSRDFVVPKEAPQTPASPKLAPAGAIVTSLPPSSTPGVTIRATHDQSATVDGPSMSECSSSVASSVVAAHDSGNPLQSPPSPFIPDSVLKSLQLPSTAALPNSVTNYSLSSAFSTASLGRRRKIFSGAVSSLMGGGDMSLAAQQRAEYEERVNYLESELARYKTYSRLLEAELFRLQRVTPSFAQQLYAHNSPQFLPATFPPAPAGSSGHLMTAPQPLFHPRWVTSPGATSQPMPPDLVEESLTPSPTEPVAALGPRDPLTTVGDDQKPVSMVTTAYYTSPTSLPPTPLGKRSYGPSSSPYVSMRQGSGSRLHRYRQMQFRHQRQHQQQQYLNALAALKSSPALQHAPPPYQQQQLALSPHQIQSQRTLVPPSTSLVSEEASTSDSDNPSPPSQPSLYEVL